MALPGGIDGNNENNLSELSPTEQIFERVNITKVMSPATEQRSDPAADPHTLISILT
jgi:hypothetical protein